jgi:unsaturated rhamnogalacturonyl hydrolase
MKMMTKLVTGLCPVLLLAVTGCRSVSANNGADAYFKSWPKGQSPLEIGTKVSQHFADSPHFNSFKPGPPAFIIYPEVCTWYGALTFSQVSHVKGLKGELIRRFEPLFNTETNLLPAPVHVDLSVFGAVPLEIYILNADPRCLALGKEYADKQWAQPTGTNANA